MRADDAERALLGEVEIVSDFVLPCAHCGIPCEGTFEVWYVEDERRKIFVVDRPTLRELLEGAVKAAADGRVYDRLPLFIRTWNECVGWAALDEAFRVDSADLLAAVDVMAVHRAEDDERLVGLLASLREFVARPRLESRELWARET